MQSCWFANPNVLFCHDKATAFTVGKDFAAKSV